MGLEMYGEVSNQIFIDELRYTERCTKWPQVKDTSPQLVVLLAQNFTIGERLQLNCVEIVLGIPFTVLKLTQTNNCTAVRYRFNTSIILWWYYLIGAVDQVYMYIIRKMENS